jgi:hypothetical protein
VRRAAKVDANQREVVAALRGAGATVQLLHAVGEGCPDLLVGYRGGNYLLEVKGRQQAAKRAEADADAGNLAPRLARASRGRKQPRGGAWRYRDAFLSWSYRVKRTGGEHVGCSTRPRRRNPLRGTSLT